MTLPPTRTEPVAAPGRTRIRPGHLVAAGLALYAVLQAWIITHFDGTYDAGDSVMHFLFAAHVPSHPENLLNHWAKPFFTLLATPFAQLGFEGMKGMQCLLALATAWMAFRYAALAGWRMAWLAPVFVLAAPAYFGAQFSGLTEPLFACMLMAGALLSLLRRYWAAALLVSLLPFVRTEGFFILGIYALSFLSQRAWWPTLGLGAGLLLYSVVGAAYYDDDLLWVFTQNPYQTALGNYGSGTWGHYFEQYIFVVGVPLYGLTIVGVLAQAGALRIPALVRWRGRLPALPPMWWGAVVLPFGVYFLLHVYFWATGTGHSLGMVRVMIAIVPLGALLALYGLQALAGLVPSAGRRLGLDRVLMGLVAAYVAAFPLLPNPASLHLPRDLQPTADQVIVREAALRLAELRPGKADLPIYASHPSLSYYAGLDPFDALAYKKLHLITEPVPSGALLVWDSWFSVMEDGVAPDFWEKYPADYALLWQRDTVDKGARSEVRIYESHK